MEPNSISIAQSKFEKTLTIFLDDFIVGFLMFNTVKEELDSYWIYRIMVNKDHQGKCIAK
ncbi:GNAT family N-acetyltransferase [Terribacillus sp. 179-K 1B1 HS]